QDPAGLKSSKSAAEALRKIAYTGSRFASRGDNSGTYKAEQRLWTASSIETKDRKDDWYLETGLGMGATLNFAVQSDAYTLSDRATWLAFKNKANHAIAYQGDPPMFNQYGVVPISKKHCPNVKTELAKIFVDWLLGIEGQAEIASFRRNGQQLFFPNAVR
ncbi:MAG: sulfate transporter, partial [Alphaproteobacteria bacterium]|nr:sulfate transporter [Alphaproteobacteria bacterium]